MKNTFSYFIKRATDWLFRKRSPALITFQSGMSLLTMCLVGSWALSFSYEDAKRVVELDLQSSTTSHLILMVCFIISVALITVGLIGMICKAVNEQRLNSKRKTIVIEQRGLVDTSDSPLSEYVRKSCTWHVDTIIHDIRERLINNLITYPEVALNKINNLKLSIDEKTSQCAASDISICYGGVFPVPFAFYSGYLLDDESKITIYDWDRDNSEWRDLDADDDDEVFTIVKPELISKSVVLAVSVSYPVDRQAISETFPELPVHFLSLPTLDRNNHWSIDKQNRLSGQFFEYCKMLLGLGVEQIHLILAAQNSVAFRFGQAYDKRNLPYISIYQYERAQPIKYPWNVTLTQKAGESPVILNTEIQNVA
ncbi:SAVED domain-containing protein [Pseudoalteromonas galatheae]|uniref:SAVED domain-containing protein n=1 Tax=Pseudoalteromonas galatheae TaxID=579562 RepID=UPI0030D35B7D